MCFLARLVRAHGLPTIGFRLFFHRDSSRVCKLNSRPIVLLEVGFEIARLAPCNVQSIILEYFYFPGFCALTETPIRGTGDDAIDFHGIGSNANDYFWRAVMTFNRIRLVLCCLALFILAVCVSSASLNAQSSTQGSITGSVLDSSEAVVPGANVSIVNLATGFTVNLVTDSSGYFKAPLLEPGRYTVTITHLTLPTIARKTSLWWSARLRPSSRVSLSLRHRLRLSSPSKPRS